jgi:hypothetical protein
MHVAFAGVGDLAAAKDLLHRAEQAALLANEVEEIFSLKTYQDVTVSEFLSHNSQMVSAIERGELWDGMKLPPKADAAC